MEAVVEAARAALSSVKVAGAYDRVFNDECMVSFADPYSPGGLYVSLSTFQGFSEKYVTMDHERTGNKLYLHIRSTKVPKPEAESHSGASLAVF